MSQRHRLPANINPALVQSIVPVPPACRYGQHEMLIRAEWILASTGDVGPTFNRHWVGVGLYSPPAVRIPGAIERRAPHCIPHIGVVPKQIINSSSINIVSTVHRSYLITLITKAIDNTSISYQPLCLCCWSGDISSLLFTKN